MKAIIAMLIMLVLVTVCGCQMFGFGRSESRSGGMVAEDRTFSILVPRSTTIKQGESEEISVTINRGAYFKRDVTLDVKCEGISITPDSVMVKASDKPDVVFKVAAERGAAIGEYRVTIRGFPEDGQMASTDFTVKVVAQ